MRCVICFFLVGELRRGTQNLRRGTHNMRRGTQNLRRGTQNLLSYHRALYRTLHHQLGSGRNLKLLERGLSVVLHWLCTSGVVYACCAINVVRVCAYVSVWVVAFACV